jgi:type I restriction enzyme R subunit
VNYTEEGMNKTKTGERISEKSLPEAFHSDDYQILIVAEKYQTGFDEPLLHTMFVDKKLSGVKAVQTLSRLNRTARGKQDTFVLDFVNSAEEIKEAFEPYYEETVLLEETNPNVVYDLKNTLDEYRVYQQAEIDKFAEIFYSGKEQSADDLGRLQGTIRPALDRYVALAVEKKDLFKSTLARFNRIYAFITQVCRLFDKNLHKFSVYAKFLAMQLPKADIEEVNVDDKVLLEYYRLEKDFDGAVELKGTEEGFAPITGEAGRREKKKDPLTVLIDKINKRYGTNFTEMDKVLVQMENDYAAQDKWQSYAKNNDRKTFMLLFEKDFPNMAAQRYEQNDDFFVRMFSDPDMMKQVMETVGSVLYERLRKGQNGDYDMQQSVLPNVAEEIEQFDKNVSSSLK